MGDDLTSLYAAIGGALAITGLFLLLRARSGKFKRKKMIEYIGAPFLIFGCIILALPILKMLAHVLVVLLMAISS